MTLFFVCIRSLSQCVNMASLSTSTERLVSKKYEGSPTKLAFACLAACLGPLSFGYTLGYSSSAISEMLKLDILGKYQAGWFGSIVTIGAMGGGPLGGWLIEKYGRKKTIALISFPFLLGWILISSSSNYLILYLGRIFCGVGSGMVCVTCPVYIAEVTIKSLRGLLGSCVQLSITIGILIAYLLGMKFSYIQMAKTGLLIPVISLVIAFYLPETPRWLLLRNRRSDALKSLASLRGTHTDIEEECRDIEEGLDDQQVTLRDMVTRPELKRPMSISAGLMIFQQLTGINAVLFYTVPIFKDSGYADQSHWASVIIGITQVVCTLLACWLMDRAGRRKLLIFGGVVMGISTFTLGLYYAMKDYNASLVANLSGMALGSLMVFMIGFSLGWGPIPMLVMSEIFPSQARGKAGACSIFISWLSAFIVTKEFITLKDTIGPAETFWMFSICCFLGTVFVWLILPETKGKSLEEIELYFLGRSMLKKTTI